MYLLVINQMYIKSSTQRNSASHAQLRVAFMVEIGVDEDELYVCLIDMQSQLS